MSEIIDVPTKDVSVKIVEWKTIGAQENFTVLGLGDDNQVYFWRDQKWNIL